MNQKLLTLFSLLLLAISVSVMLLAGGGLWLLRRGQNTQGQAIHIASLAPLTPTVPPSPVGPAVPNPGTEPLLPVAVLPAIDPVVPTMAVQVAPTAAPPKSQVVVPAASHLIIPRLNLDVPVVTAPMAGQSWQVDHLQQAVGHLEGTAAPGSNSNTVLAGHVSLPDGSAGPFARLDQLVPDDELWLVTDAHRFRYVVDGHQIVDPAAVEVTYPTDTGRVTLVTCSNWVEADGRYASRLVVTGHLVGG